MVPGNLDFDKAFAVVMQYWQSQASGKVEGASHNGVYLIQFDEFQNDKAACIGIMRAIGDWNCPSVNSPPQNNIFILPIFTGTYLYNADWKEVMLFSNYKVQRFHL